MEGGAEKQTARKGWIDGYARVPERSRRPSPSFSGVVARHVVEEPDATVSSRPMITGNAISMTTEGDTSHPPPGIPVECGDGGSEGDPAATERWRRTAPTEWSGYITSRLIAICIG